MHIPVRIVNPRLSQSCILIPTKQSVHKMHLYIFPIRERYHKLIGFTTNPNVKLPYLARGLTLDICSLMFFYENT